MTANICKTLMAALVAGTALAANAQESRMLNPITRPQAKAALPGGAIPVKPPVPVPREKGEAAVQKLAAAWSDRKLDGVLGSQFSDRDRLVDALQTKVPRDARLRVVSVQGWQVLEQHRIGGFLVSKLSVTASTQVEFGGAAGYQVRPGTNEYILTLNDGSGQ